MKHLFRLRIAGKRQVTIPQRMLDVLHLSEGDELQILVEGNKITGARACVMAPSDLFPPEILAKLKARNLPKKDKSPAAGPFIRADRISEMLSKSKYTKPLKTLENS
jgi:bifunctional DNA-binding transcriptional regulator/antitoxin component of YhaV-PrlF toxin-antitoxin module